METIDIKIVEGMPPVPPRTLYVIYERPSDFPESFVVRKWTVYPHPVYGQVVPSLEAHAVTDTLDAARASIPGPFVSIGRRQPEDDAKIVEVWI